MIMVLRMFVAILVIACGCSAYNYNYCGAPAPKLQEKVPNAELIQVTLITRHGDRAPANVLPNENMNWYCGTSDVTSLLGSLVPSGILFRHLLFPNVII